MAGNFSMTNAFSTRGVIGATSERAFTVASFYVRLELMRKKGRIKESRKKLLMDKCNEDEENSALKDMKDDTEDGRREGSVEVKEEIRQDKRDSERKESEERVKSEEKVEEKSEEALKEEEKSKEKETEKCEEKLKEEARRQKSAEATRRCRSRQREVLEKEEVENKD